MIIDDYNVRRIQKQDINDLFKIAKASLTEKGIENIRDDLLLIGLKNACAKKLQTFDFGLFKLNTLVGYAFMDVNHVFYEKDATGLINTIYILPEHRNEKNYMKIIDFILDFNNNLEIKKIKTTDNWTLCNDCPILLELLNKIVKKTTKVYNLER